MFQASTMSYALTTKSLRLFAEEVLPRFRSEVYEPWLKEHRMKRLLLPTGGKGADRGQDTDVGADAGKAIKRTTQAA
ncbi:MAG: hypothetical protein ACLQUZ_14725 [Rhizomicrobium sp.]